MKKFLSWLIILLPWFISGIIFNDTIFYKTIVKPSFAPPGIVFAIVWPILFILLATSIYRVKDKANSNYFKILIINYIFNQLYSYLFFSLHSIFLALIDTIFVLVSSIILFIETKKIDKTAAYLLIPYILWNIFATILSISIFILNI